MQNSANNDDRWVFDCPWHGMEIEAFCFRAFDVRYKNHWRKYTLQYSDFTNNERDEFIKKFKNKK